MPRGLRPPPPPPRKPAPAKDLTPATERQKETLYRILDPDYARFIPTMTKREAHTLISDFMKEIYGDRWPDRPSEKQEAFLRKRGRWYDQMPRREATTLIGQIIKEEEAFNRQYGRR